MSRDLVDLLVVGAGDPGPPPDVAALLRRVGRRRRRRRVLTATAAAASLVAGGIAVDLTQRDAGRHTLVQGDERSSPTSREAAVRPGSWRPVEIGMPGALAPYVAWTGARVLVFYEATPDQTLVDGELYDPATNRSKPINRGFLEWRGGAAVVWTGDELLVWGGGSGTTAMHQGGAYDPVTNRWRALPNAPSVAVEIAGEAVWTGAEMVLPGRSLAYDPRADRWRRITASPLGPRRTSSTVWTGREVIVWGGCDVDSVQCDDASPAAAAGDGAAYDPRADRWRMLPSPPLSPRQRPQAVWTGREMIIWGGLLDRSGMGSWAAAYNPTTDSWRALPNSPFPPRADAVMAWTGQELLVWDGHDGASYDPVADRWSRLPPSPLSPRDRTGNVWTGRELYIVGGYPGEGSAAFTPTG